jgi:hypothetical protein
LKFYEFKKILWKNNRLMDLEMLRLTKAMDLEEHDILLVVNFIDVKNCLSQILLCLSSQFEILQVFKIFWTNINMTSFF